MPTNNGIYTAIKEFSLVKLISRAAMNILSQVCRCDLCGQRTERYTMICEDCYSDIIKFNLPELQYDLLNWPTFYHTIKPVRFDHLIAIAPYQWPYSRWIIQLKYTGNFEISKLLSELMLVAWQSKPAFKEYKENDSIAVMSVPIHIKKWQKRGYNQAYLLAKCFSKMTNLPNLSHVLIRSKATQNQVGLTGVQRRKNLKKAFVLQEGIALPEHVILIDDVLTTGTTANEISQLLKQHGVKIVTVFTLCLSLPSKKKS